MTVNPEKITIKGSEPLVESIEKAVVKVDVTGRADSGTVQGNLVLYDSQGNIVDQSKLSNNLNTEKHSWSFSPFHASLIIILSQKSEALHFWNADSLPSLSPPEESAFL